MKPFADDIPEDPPEKPRIRIPADTREVFDLPGKPGISYDVKEPLKMFSQFHCHNYLYSDIAQKSLDPVYTLTIWFVPNTSKFFWSITSKTMDRMNYKPRYCGPFSSNEKAYNDILSLWGITGADLKRIA